MTGPVQAQLGGFAGERLRRNVRQWINTFDIHRYVGLLETGRPGGGLLAGLWLEAATRACEWASDALLRQRAMGMLERVLAAEDRAGPGEFALLGGALRAAGEVWQNGPALRAADGMPVAPAEVPADPDGAEAFLWNRLFALQTVDGDGFRADLPPSGWRPQGYYAGPLASDARSALALTLFPSLFYAVTPDGLRIDHYGPSSAVLTAGGTEVAIRQTTEYPSDGRVSVAVTPRQPAEFTLQPRIPRWCGSPVIELNGKPVPARRLRRVWRAGDRLELDFPMRPLWHRGNGVNRGRLALVRGPLAYFAEAGPGAKAGPVTVSVPVSAETPGPWCTIAGTGVQLRPLATLGEWYRSDAEKFRWLESLASHPEWASDPDRGRTLPYSIWLNA